jgi:hypothetical protein
MGGDPGIWAMALSLPFAQYRQILMWVADAVKAIAVLPADGSLTVCV